jgi:hypothetical protein
MGLVIPVRRCVDWRMREVDTRSVAVPDWSSPFLTPIKHFSHCVDQPRVAEYGWIVFGKIDWHA